MRRAPLPAGVRRGPEISITVDGAPRRAYLGETVAAALMADGGPGIRVSRGGETRGIYCGMGVCFECLVVIDGVPNARACMTWIRDGMDIRHMDGLAVAGLTKEDDHDA